MTVERSILLIVGLIVLGSALLAAFASPNWLWLTGIMGAHLVQASFTGICPVVMTLKKMGLPTKLGLRKLPSARTSPPSVRSATPCNSRLSVLTSI
jgi:hypothetical protein